MERMNGLDLFSGIGGITLALSEWVRPITYVEIDRYGQAVLASRMADGLLHPAPIWDDVNTLHASDLPAKPDIIYGGFPCQDLSLAGLQKGLGGERSGLFFQVIRLAQECRPEFVFLENVPGIYSNGIERVLEEISAIGYDCRYGVLSAEDVGARHKRERWFLLAHARSQGLEGVHEKAGQEHLQPTSRNPWEQRDIQEWEPEPDVARVAHGIPFRMDRTKALGNSVVPAQVTEVFKRLMGF